MTSPGNRTTKRSATRRAEILEAALQCIAEDGLKALTARRLCERTGQSLGQLTYHYASMDEILIDAHCAALDRSRAANKAAMAAANGGPRETLRLLLWQPYLPPLLDMGYVRMRAELWLAALRHPVLAESEKDHLDYFRQTVRTILTRFDGATEAGARAAADVINALMDGLWLDWLRRSDKAVIAAGIEGCLAIADAMALLVPAEKPEPA